LLTFLKQNRWSLLWAVFIIVLNTLPGQVLPKLPVFADLFKPDKLVHLFLFGVYAWLQIRGYKNQDQFPFLKGHAVFIALSAGILLGVFTELLQEFYIPNRQGDIYDFIADAAGCLAGSAIRVRIRE